MIKKYNTDSFLIMIIIIIIMIYVHIYHTMASNGINEYTAGPKMGNTYKMETSLRC